MRTLASSKGNKNLTKRKPFNNLRTITSTTKMLQTPLILRPRHEKPPPYEHAKNEPSKKEKYNSCTNYNP
jgi:hypothetical protein